MIFTVRCINSETGYHRIAVGRRGAICLLDHDLKTEMLAYKISGQPVDCLRSMLDTIRYCNTGFFDSINAQILDCPVVIKKSALVYKRNINSIDNYDFLEDRVPGAVKGPLYKEQVTGHIAQLVLKRLKSNGRVLVLDRMKNLISLVPRVVIPEYWLDSIYKKGYAVIDGSFIADYATTVDQDWWESHQCVSFLAYNYTNEGGLFCKRIVTVDKRTLPGYNKTLKKQPVPLYTKPRYKL